MCPLTPPIVYRTELFPGGAARRLKRKHADLCPTGVFKAKEALAYMYTCPITKHYVVAARGDTRKCADGRHYVCTLLGLRCTMKYDGPADDNNQRKDKP